MKKTRLLFLILLQLMVSISSRAETYEANGVTWKFYVLDNKAVIEGETQGKNAFQGALNIPPTVQYGGTTYPVGSIRDHAFRDYSGVTSVTIPDNVFIAPFAFESLSNLQELNIGHHITFQRNAFYDCPKLNSTNIHYQPSELPYIIESGLLGGLDWAGTSFTVPEGVTKIGSSAFNLCTSLTSIVLPSTLTSIEGHAFSGCKNIRTMTIPDNVTAIGVGAFSRCTNLTSINIPEGVTTIGSSTFWQCEKLTSVTLPSTLTAIQDHAFYMCKSLAGTLSIPASVTSIGNEAFIGCRSLSGPLVLPTGLNSLGQSAFSGCLGFTGTLNIPTGITVIPERAFQGCKGLAEVVFPAGLTKIDEAAFGGCEGLTGTLTIPSGVTLGVYAFNGTGYTNVILPDDMTEIPSALFFHCANLTSVHVGSGLTTIGMRAFENCPLLDFEFPTGVTTIGAAAFKDCTSLTHVFIPANATTIPDNIYDNCRNLTGNLELPSTVQSIGQNAFRNTALNITLPNANFTMGQRALFGIRGQNIRIPKNMTDLRWFQVKDYDNSTYHNVIDPELESFALEEGSQLHYFSEDLFSVFSADVDANPLPNLKFIDLHFMPDDVEGYHGPYSDFVASGSSGFPYGLNEIGRTTTNENTCFYNLAKHVMVYMPASYRPRLVDDGENFVFGNECDKFVVYDGYSYPIQHAFTAATVKYDREFSGTSCQTVYLPYATPLPTGMQAYRLVKKSLDAHGDKAFVFREIPTGTQLEANHPYLVRVTDGGTHTFPELTNVEVPVSPALDAAGQIGIEDSDWKFYGTTDKIKNPEAYAKKAYYLNGNKWWAVQDGEENDYIAPFRCFVSSPTGAAAAKSFVMVFEGEEDNTVTGIKQLESDTENDIKSGKYPFYSIDGKLVGHDYDKLESGQIYIVNGKKFYKF